MPLGAAADRLRRHPLPLHLAAQAARRPSTAFTAMKLRFVLALATILLAGIYDAWRLADSRSVQLFGRVVDRVETTRPLVALTFDDGPVPGGANSILAILREAGVPATFFFTGRELAENPELGPRFVAAGHELGNHSYSHVSFLLKPQSLIRTEIEATDSLIRRAGETGEILFRPPYGKKLVALPWYLSRTDRTTVMWDIEPDRKWRRTRIASSTTSTIAFVPGRSSSST